MDLNITAIVEIPVGSHYKYEVDKNTGELTIDRPLPVPLPYNYGFVPATLADDSDPLDVCILTNKPIHPLTKVKVTILGAFICDDNGQKDDKLVAKVVGEELSESERNNYLSFVDHYLSTYKPGFTVLSFVEANDAVKIFQEAVDLYERTEWMNG